jgi:predicted RNase H-like HicB family nuclease
MVVNSADLTPEEAEERKKKAFGLHVDVRDALSQGRAALWETARALYEFDEMHGWTALGYDRIGDWLADPEISITKSQFYRLTGVWRELVVIRKVDTTSVRELEPSKVDIVLPAVRSGRVKLDEALEDTKSMGARDLREEYISRPDRPSVPQSAPLSQTQVMMDETGDDDRTCAACGEGEFHKVDCMHAVLPEDDEPAPVNDGSAAPVVASAVQPAQNDDVGGSGQVSGISVTDGTPTMVGNVLHETDEKSPVATFTMDLPEDYSDRMDNLKAALDVAKEAVTRPDREAPDRRAKKEALVTLIDAAEAVLL